MRTREDVTLHIDWSNGANVEIVLVLTGSIELVTESVLLEELSCIRTDNDIIVNLMQVDFFLASLGSYFLEQLAQRIRPNKRQLKIIAPQDSAIKRGFEILNLAEISNIQIQYQEPVFRN